jgi:hypothetical protein
MEAVIASPLQTDWAAVDVSPYASLVITILMMIVMRLFEASGVLDKHSVLMLHQD